MMMRIHGDPQKVHYYFVPKFEIRVEHKRRIVQSLYDQIPPDERDSKSSVYDEETEKYKRHSRNSLESDDTMDNSLSANEGGYLSDVSNSASPSRPPDIISHHRRRSRPSDSVIDRINNNGSVSDTDDDNARLHQFERKPPRGKSSRRKNQQPVEESKVDAYNSSRKRFSWTDSGISSSIGTGPHSKKFPFTTSTERVDKSKSTEELPRMRNIVFDTFNAVNELKDLQRSFRRAHSEHKLCRFFPDSDSAISSSQQDNVLVQTRTNESEPPPPPQTAPPPPPDVINTDAKIQTCDMESKVHTFNTDANVEKSPNKNFISKDEMDNLQIIDNEKEDERRDSHSPINVKLEPDDDVRDDNYDDVLSEQISIQDIRHLSSDRTHKSKGFINGLKKVASHLKPSFRTNATILSKDVSSEFSFAKRKNDEDTIKELHTITSKFRKEITHIQNISIDNLDLDGCKTPLDEENIQNMLLDKLSVKPNSTTTFIQKVFGRTRSYNARPCKKNSSNRKSFCENVFISPCNANTYSPVSESNNYSRRTDMRSRGKCNSISTDENACFEYTSSSLSHSHDENLYLENLCASPSNDEPYLEHDESGRNCVVDNEDMHEQEWENGSRVHSLSHTHGSRDSQRSSHRAHVDTHESSNNSNSSSHQVNMNVCPQVNSYSHSSLELHRGYGGEFLQRKTDCPQCAYADYLDYLQFLRFRDGRCDMGYIWSPEPYAANVYSSYTKQNYQQCSESSCYPPEDHEYNGDLVSDSNRCNFRPEVIDDIRTNNDCLEYQPEDEIRDSEYGTYV